jgi:phosphate/sulfate permease
VLSLPDAVSPVVWRWNVSEASASALEVEQNGTQYVLMMKTLEGKTQKIAAFDGRDKAVNALMTASSVMERKGHGGVSIENASEGMKWVIAVLGVLLVIGLFFILARMTPTVTTPYVATNNTSGTVPGEASSAGVPVSADEMLGEGF